MERRDGKGWRESGGGITGAGRALCQRAPRAYRTSSTALRHPMAVALFDDHRGYFGVTVCSSTAEQATLVRTRRGLMGNLVNEVSVNGRSLACSIARSFALGPLPVHSGRTHSTLSSDYITDMCQERDKQCYSAYHLIHGAVAAVAAALCRRAGMPPFESTL